MTLFWVLGSQVRGKSLPGGFLPPGSNATTRLTLHRTEESHSDSVPGGCGSRALY